MTDLKQIKQHTQITTLSSLLSVTWIRNAVNDDKTDL